MYNSKLTRGIMRVLIIEDELKISNFLMKGFKEEGYAVDVSLDGEKGYEMAISDHFDLIVLDLMLPSMDGLTICKKLRENNIEIPIIMLTAKASVDDKVTGFDTGTDDYLVKPFVFAELLARSRSLLRKNSKDKISKLKVADLELDLTTHRVFRGDKEIMLTSREYGLLEYFMRNEGSIITRTMITENIWDINYDSFTNVIDVYINYLRNKIDKDYEIKLIHTIRGRGYMFSGVQ